jgi:dTDP-4-amino-4,6-dideoxygalactose transaminase
MAAILIDVKEGDEIIVPSFTFESTVNAFVLRGAKIVFADSEDSSPNIDTSKIEALITDRTIAIVPVHYAGVACDMDRIMAIAQKHGLYVIEDAAHAIDSYYHSRPVGSIGHLAAFSFHESKNVTSGEGGMLVINDSSFNERAEIIREKGTNRSKFFRGEIDKYSWVDIGSSFLPSDMIAAFLYAQLEAIDNIQQKRRLIWNQYYEGLKGLSDKGKIILPTINLNADNNAHMFFILVQDIETRSALINFLRDNGIQAVFHYLGLHSSPYFSAKHDGRELNNSNIYTERLLRLPMYYDLNTDELNLIIHAIEDFYHLLQE